MIDVNNINLIKKRLEKFKELSSLFEYTLNFFININGCNIALRGSVATYEIDRYSDLDLIITISDKDSLEFFEKNFSQGLNHVGKLLSTFNASHIGKPDLHIYYIRMNNFITKLDIEIFQGNNIKHNEEKKIIILKQDWGVFAGFKPERIKSDYFNIIYKKFSVWTWNIFYLIERGEYFQASRALDFSREHALLPLIRKNLNLPINDGHRRIEQTFPEYLINDLKSTYPGKLERAVMFKALFSLMDIFEESWVNLEFKNKDDLKLFKEIKSCILYDLN